MAGGKINSLGVIIARTGNEHGNALRAVELAQGALASGKDTGILLLTDGVWNALRGSGPVSERLESFIRDGGRVYLSAEHARAAGMPTERAIRGIEPVEGVYGSLVDMVMERWDKVVIC